MKFTLIKILKINFSLFEDLKFDIVRTAYNTKIHLKIKTLNENIVKSLLNIILNRLYIFTKR